MATITSNTFSVTVTSYPELFDDYGGNTFSGEAGALAVNDAWASTTYDYTPRYAPTIPTIPTPTGSPSKPGSSQVNPNAADEYLVVDVSGWNTAYNNATYKKIFIAKGTDLHSEATKTMTAAGTAQDPRWIVYWDNDTPSNVQDIKPWNLSAGDRVQMHRVNLSGANYHYIVGLNWGNVVSGYSNSIGRTTSTTNTTYYRCQKENTNLVTGLFLEGSNTMVYECAFLDANINQPEGSEIIVLGGSGHRIISCEARDNNTFIEIPPGWNDNDLVIEDCDIYKEQRYDISGNEDAGGAYVMGEALTGFKNCSGATSANPVRFYGNRYWGTRPTSPGISSVNSGYCVGTSPTTAKQYIDIRWNVFQDNSRNCIRFSDDATLAGSGNISIVRNIMGDHVDNILGSSSVGYVCYLNYDQTEFYLNTVTNSPNADGLAEFYRADTGSDDLDMMGNFFQDTTGYANTGKLLNEQIGYNAYAGTYTTLNVTYGNDYEAASKAALNMGDFTYTRKKLTGPETSTISGVVPTTSTPSAFRALVPTSGGDQIGSRAGIGVDDDY